MGTGKLYNIGYVSAQRISGGTITGTWDGEAIPSAPGGSMTANIGANFDYGISGLSYMSSQTISGGTFIGGLHYPADFIVYKEGNTYYCKNGRDGSTIASNTDASTLLNSSIYPGCRTYVTSGTYHISSSVIIKDNSYLQGGMYTQMNISGNYTNCFLITGMVYPNYNPKSRTLSDFTINLPKVTNQGYSGSVIKFDVVSPGGDWNDTTNLKFVTIKNIHITDHDNLEGGENGCLSGATGIEIFVSGGRCGVSFLTFRDIIIDSVGTGIGINMYSSNNYGWMNGLKFEDVCIYYPIVGVDFNTHLARTMVNTANNNTNGNLWKSVKIQSYTQTTDGFKNINAASNIFIDCFNWDFTVIAENPNFSWSIASGAARTIIIGTDLAFVSKTHYFDSGSATTIINPYLNKLTTTEFSDDVDIDGTLTIDNGYLNAPSITGQNIYLYKGIDEDVHIRLRESASHGFDITYSGASDNRFHLTRLNNSNNIDVLKIDRNDGDITVASSLTAGGRIMSNTSLRVQDTTTPYVEALVLSAADNTIDFRIGPDTYNHYWRYSGQQSGDANYLYQYVGNGAGTPFWHTRYHETTPVIDTHSKIDMQNSGSIVNATGISSQNISGGSVTTANLTLAGGATFTYMSSQTISGGTITGDLRYPYSYIVYTDGGTTYAKNGATGRIDYSDSTAWKPLQYAIDNTDGGTVYLGSNIDLESTISGTCLTQDAEKECTLDLGGHVITCTSDLGGGVTRYVFKMCRRFHVQNGHIRTTEFEGPWSDSQPGTINFGKYSAVFYYDGDDYTPTYNDRNTSRLSNLVISNDFRNYNHGLPCSGIAILLQTGTGSDYIENVNVDNIEINHFYMAIALMNRGTTSTNYINGNMFNHIQGSYNENFFILSGNVGADGASHNAVRQNQFTNYQFQVGSNTQHIIGLYGNAIGNVFVGRSIDNNVAVNEYPYAMYSGNKTALVASNGPHCNYIHDIDFYQPNDRLLVQDYIVTASKPARQMNTYIDDHSVPVAHFYRLSCNSYQGPATTGVAGGSDTQVQFNDGGTNFGGDSAFTWDKDSDTLTVAGAISSQAISSGRIIGDFHAPYDYILYKSNDNYYVKNSRNGETNSYTDFSTALDTTLHKGISVFLPSGKYYVSSTINMPTAYSIYGAGKGTDLFIRDNVDVFFVSGSHFGCTVSDLTVTLPEKAKQYDSACIHLHADTYMIENCTFKNLYFRESGSYITEYSDATSGGGGAKPEYYRSGTVIRCEASGGNILSNRFSNILTQWVGTVIGFYMYDTDTDDYINGNTFENFYVNGYKYGIDFSHMIRSKYFTNRNHFRDIKLESESAVSVDGIKHIKGVRNIFEDCLVWDWNSELGGYAISFHKSSNNAFMNAQGFDDENDWYDSGSSTVMFTHGLMGNDNYQASELQIERIRANDWKIRNNDKGGYPRIFGCYPGNNLARMYSGTTAILNFYHGNYDMISNNPASETFRIMSQGDLELFCSDGKDIEFMENYSNMFTMRWNDGTPLLFGRDGSNNNMMIRANSSDNTPYLFFSGSTGRIGINKNTPDYTLDVVGNAYISNGISSNILHLTDGINVTSTDAYNEIINVTTVNDKTADILRVGNASNQWGHFWRYSGQQSGDSNFLYQYAENGTGTPFWHTRFHEQTRVIDTHSKIDMQNSGSIVNATGISSQAISGGCLLNLGLPATYVIFKNDNGYFCVDGTNKEVKSFDASDAQVPIQWALDNLSASVGGKVFIKEGTYTLDDTLTVSKLRTTIEGVGRATKLDFQNRSCNGITISGARFCTVRSMRIQKADNGIFVMRGDKAGEDNEKPEELKLQNVDTDYCNIGISLKDAYGVHVQQCTADSNYWHGFVYDGHETGTSNSVGGGCVLLGSTFYNNKGAGVLIKNAVGICLDNVISETNQSGNIVISGVTECLLNACSAENANKGNFPYEYAILRNSKYVTTMDVTLNNCYAGQLRCYVDAQRTKISHCRFASKDDDVSIEATSHADNLIIEGGYYNSSLSIDPGASNVIKILGGAISSQAISGGKATFGTTTFAGNIISGLADPTFNSGAANKHYVNYPDFVSSQAISGSWTTPIYRGAGKPAASVGYEGKIIRTSGASGEGTWVWMCVQNSADGYEWIQLGVST